MPHKKSTQEIEPLMRRMHVIRSMFSMRVFTEAEAVAEINNIRVALGLSVHTKSEEQDVLHWLRTLRRIA